MTDTQGGNKSTQAQLDYRQEINRILGRIDNQATLRRIYNYMSRLLRSQC